MPLTPGLILKDWFLEVWTKGRTDFIHEYLSPNGLIHGMDENRATATGPEGFLPFFNKIRSAFPDIHFQVHEVVESGPMAAARWSAQATHTGDGLGMFATNRPITLTGMTIVRADGGKIVEAWNEWDRLGLMTAIGAVVPAT